MGGGRRIDKVTGVSGTTIDTSKPNVTQLREALEREYNALYDKTKVIYGDMILVDAGFLKGYEYSLDGSESAHYRNGIPITPGDHTLRIRKPNGVWSEEVEIHDVYSVMSAWIGIEDTGTTPIVGDVLNPSVTVGGGSGSYKTEVSGKDAEGAVVTVPVSSTEVGTYTFTVIVTDDHLTVGGVPVSATAATEVTVTDTMSIGMFTCRVTGRDTATIIAYHKDRNPDATRILVPGTVAYRSAEYTITAIAPRVFADDEYLTYVWLPGIEVIEENLFANCPKLMEVDSE